MSKPALGRGLGSLLASRPKPASAMGASNVSPGVAALINGTPPGCGAAGPSKTASLPQQMESAARRTILRGLLIGADLLLCLLAFLFVQRQPSLPVYELALCVAAVVVGGIMSCVALVGESFSAVPLAR